MSSAGGASPKVVVIDHHDSFTYNLVHAIAARGARSTVLLCDRIGVEDVERLEPDGILLSPGPCAPDQAGVSLALVRALSGRVPILGVCLGHQVIAQAFGARITRATRVVHGELESVEHDGRGLFEGVPSPLRATRYNSLTVDPESLPACLAATGWSSDRDLMALSHRRDPTHGVQFHPESILSEMGPRVLANWLAGLPRRAGSGGA